MKPESSELERALERLTQAGLERTPPQQSDCLAVLRSGDDDVLAVVSAAGRVRRAYFGNRIKLNFLVNMKSGLCPEDCSYCSQRRGSSASVLTYNWVSPDEVLTAVGPAVARGVKRVCLVASGRGPSERDIDRVREISAQIKEHHPELEICVSLGLLQPDQGERLANAGVYAYNHNLNTSGDRYQEICSTHRYEDRQDTLGKAKQGGLSPCSGAIFGMGENDEQIVDLAFSLRQADPDSVPVNFLIPFDGTPLAGRWELTPGRCLRILAVFRLVFPDVEVRLGAGREIHLRSLQPLALHLANSLFLGDYLTSEGQEGSDDLAMIADAGFIVEGQEVTTLPSSRVTKVAVRQRGVGTALPANY